MLFKLLYGKRQKPVEQRERENFNLKFEMKHYYFLEFKPRANEVVNIELELSHHNSPLTPA